MFPVLPPPSKTDAVDSLWNELVLRANSITLTFLRELIEDLWPKLVSSLSGIKDIQIGIPTEVAWFHVRRATHQGRNDIEVLRLKSGFLPLQDVESLRFLAGSYSGITHANWQPVNFDKRHDNAFLSFLQKLSVLRARDGICYNRYIGQVSNSDYDKCSYCQEAYKIMTTPNSKWSMALRPWFDYMSSTKMDGFRTHEYAHWFGHIISGWPDNT